MSWCIMICSVHVGFLIEGVGWDLLGCDNNRAQDESVAREGSESSVT